MRLLADTHAVLWFAAGNQALPKSARAYLADPTNEILVSHAAVWEMAIKISLGKLALDRDIQSWLARFVAGNGFGYLPMGIDHFARVGVLPHHHGDPFDRLMVAQCEAEHLAIVSRDPSFDAYGIKRLW